MIDFFALLDQPRRPWLDLNALKKKYHQLARTAHPDRANAGANFAQMEEAYRNLTNPRLRIQHLFALENVPAATATVDVPVDLSDLFMKIALALRETNPKTLEQIQSSLNKNNEEALAELRALDADWDKGDSALRARLIALSHRFAFLSRWTTQVEERLFAFAN